MLRDAIVGDLPPVELTARGGTDRAKGSHGHLTERSTSVVLH